LFELQAKELGKYTDVIYLTLPNDFKVSEYDLMMFQELNIEIIISNPNSTIATGLSAAIREIGVDGIDNLIIFYGDTLSKIPEQLNSIAGSLPPPFYKWGELKELVTTNHNGKTNTIVLVGTFRISFIKELLRLLEQNNLNIVQVFENYILNTEAQVEVIEDWLDFGHLNMYFESRKQLHESRHFNSIEVIGDHVFKRSKDTLKMNSEYFWYKSVPDELSIYFPRITGKQESGYSTEYLRCPTLQELMVFSELEAEIWKLIFNSIQEYFRSGLILKLPTNEAHENKIFKSLIVDKSLERFTQINWKSISNFLNADLQLLSHEAELSFYNSLKYVKNWDGMDFGILHGDMCATNILWDSLNTRVKLIDPRGIDSNGNPLYFGNIAYDIAKLYQSFVFDYEYIICNRYKLVQKDDGEFKVKIFKSENGEKVSKEFLESLNDMSHLDIKKIHHLSKLLLFSLIPLHGDRPDRQAAFLIQAMNNDLYLNHPE
jgi:hypothetical protein